MRWTPKHIAIGMLAVAAAILAMVAVMDPVDTTPDPVGPIGSGLPVDSSGDNPAEDPPVPSSTPPVITLGDLDPPPDPCTLIGWTDLPGETRPVTDTTPPLSLDSSSYPNATTTTFGERTGVQRIDTNRQGRPMCIGLKRAAGGGAEGTTACLSTKDVCAVVAAAHRVIAKTIR